MAFKDAALLKQGKIKIDTTGPQGNAFYLIGMAKRLCAQLGMDFAPVRKQMQASDYTNLLLVFEATFGAYVDLYISSPADPDEEDA